MMLATQLLILALLGGTTAQRMLSVYNFEPVTGTLPGYPVTNQPDSDTGPKCAQLCQRTIGCFAAVFKHIDSGQVLKVCWLKSDVVLENWIPLPNGVFCTSVAEPCQVYRKTGTALTTRDSPPFFSRLLWEGRFEPIGFALPGWPIINTPAVTSFGLCEAWCQYYSTCKAMVYKQVDPAGVNYCALYGGEQWAAIGTGPQCSAGQTCYIRKKHGVNPAAISA